MALVARVLLGLFAAISVALECAQGMQLGGHTNKAQAATALSNKLHGRKGFGVEDDLKILNETLDDVAKILSDANNTATDMLGSAMDGVNAVLQSLGTLNQAVKVVVTLPGGSSIQTQVDDLVDTVNETLKVAEQLPPTVSNVAQQLLHALQKLQKIADNTYSAFMDAQSAVEAAEASSKEAAALEAVSLASTDRDANWVGRWATAAGDEATARHGDGGRKDSLLVTSAQSLSARSIADSARGGAPVLTMDGSLLHKWPFPAKCHECCQVGKAVYHAETKSDRFIAGVRDLTKTVTEALEHIAKFADSVLETIKARAHKALDDAGNTQIPDFALKQVSKVLNNALPVAVDDIARKSLVELSSGIDHAANKSNNGLADILKQFVEYHGRKCDSVEQ